MKSLILAALAFILSAGASFADCGADPDPCEIEGGTYHVVLPDGPAVGALMFLHGWGSTGSGSLRMTGLVRTFNEAGYVVIAPDGIPRTNRSGRQWAFRPGWNSPRNDFEFLKQVKADAAERFDFDPDRALLSGFSIGGSMASYMACTNPDSFAAYAPIGGGMWRPHPEACAGPVKLLHTHGWRDGVVPLEGRVLRGTLQEPGEKPFVQGDAFATMEIWRYANVCINHKPDRFDIGDRFWTRAWDRCAEGSALEFVMHKGGHSVPRGWAAMSLAWFEAQMDNS